MREKIIGIAGGMGPESTLDLMGKIFSATPAQSEQDHIHLVVDSNPKTPDRTRFILGEGESPVPVIRAAIQRLVAAGADLILIPCNTAHTFIDELQGSTSVPIVNMITVCADWARERYDEGDCLGILATTGTVRSHTAEWSRDPTEEGPRGGSGSEEPSLDFVPPLGHIYETALEARGLGTVVPSASEQDELMQAIYGPEGIKLGHLAANTPRVAALGKKLIERGAQAVIAACTEVGLVLADCDFPVIDPLRLLAEEAVRRVKDPDAVREES